MDKAGTAFMQQGWTVVGEVGGEGSSRTCPAQNKPGLPLLRENKNGNTDFLIMLDFKAHWLLSSN